jgi:cell shape-determining protein MreC
LNLAFAATLFHARPNLGPSEKEIQDMENQKADMKNQLEVLRQENQQLRESLAVEKTKVE